MRELVRLMLEANGYEVLAVGDADEAARVCTPRGVDLLLTDVVMPEVSGSVLAERLAVLAPDMRILFMSGYSDEAVIRHGVLTAAPPSSRRSCEKPVHPNSTRPLAAQGCSVRRGLPGEAFTNRTLPQGARGLDG